jgi:hypothetical protein
MPPSDDRTSEGPRRHGRVFVLGATGMAATVLVAGGLTWASQSRDAEPAVLTASPQASAEAATRVRPGECAIVVGGRPVVVGVHRARTITMVAAVGQQVRSPDIQTARAIDAADVRKTPKVTEALGLLARAYPQEASAAANDQLAALTTPGSLTCPVEVPKKLKKEKAGESGLTPRAAALRTAMLDAFGKLSTGGYGKTAKSGDKAALAGRALDVTLAPVSDAARTRGWTLAHWLVAGAAQHHVVSVTYDGWTWSADSGTGWRPLPAPLREASDPEGGASPPTSAAPAPSAAEVKRSVAAQFLDRLHVVLATGR